MQRMAGSLPGEALAPGVSGQPDVPFSITKHRDMLRRKKKVKQFLLRFFFQVPGGAAKLSDIAKVGFFLERNTAGIWLGSVAEI